MGEKKLEEYTNLEKIAILCNFLGNTASRSIFDKLNDQDTKLILQAMQRLTKVDIKIVKAIIDELIPKFEERDEVYFSNQDTLIKDLLSSDRAKNMFGSNFGQKNLLDSIHDVDPKAMANFLLNEHPQTVALILAHLDIQNQSEIVKNLPQELQLESILRIAALEQVGPETIESLNKILGSEMSKFQNKGSNKLGGTSVVADLINSLDPTLGEKILLDLEGKDSSLSEAIKKEMFTFEDLIHADDKSLGLLFKDFASEKIARALKICSDSLKVKILKTFSLRAKQSIEEELDVLAQIKKSEVLSIQQEILEKAKNLTKENKFYIDRK